jgi:hypothetical protein
LGGAERPDRELAAAARGRLDGTVFEYQRRSRQWPCLEAIMRRAGLVLFFFLASAMAVAAADESPLTPTDVRYLKTLGQSQADLKANQPTPAMLQRLHELINDPATMQKPKARADAVYRFLDHINARFVWCSDHPKDKDCDAYKPVSGP